MRFLKFLACVLSLLFIFSCASASIAETYTCIVTSLESDEWIKIPTPSIVERLMYDVLSPIDFSSVQWSTEGDGNLALNDDFIYAVRIIRDADTPNQVETTISISETSILSDNALLETDAVTLYLLDGLYNGLSASQPSAKPLN